MKGEYEQILRFTLGALNKPKRVWGYRNYFCCDTEDHRDYKLLADMEKIGLVRRYTRFDQLCFCATLSGARAIGLGRPAFIRAGLIGKKEEVS